MLSIQLHLQTVQPYEFYYFPSNTIPGKAASGLAFRRLEFSSQINNYKATVQLRAGKVLPTANPDTAHNTH